MLPVKLKSFVYFRASGLCEYCKSPANFSPQPFAIEHILPKVKGGSNDTNNLALSCQGCNNFKYNKTEGIDLVTGDKSGIFNPRTDNWNVHFSWSDDGTEIIGITAKGRVTVNELKLNRNPIRNLRRLLVDDGRHPPLEDK